MTPSLQIIKSEPGRVLASWGNTLLWLTAKDDDPATMRFAHQQLARLSESHPEGIGFVIFVRARTPLPDGEARKEAAKMFANLAPNFRAVGAIVEGSGFWAGAARSVMAGITALMRSPYPVKIFSTAEDMASWLAPRVGSAEMGLRQAMDEMIGRLEASMTPDG